MKIFFHVILLISFFEIGNSFVKRTFLRMSLQKFIQMSEEPRKFPISYPHYKKMNRSSSMEDEQPLHARDQIMQRRYYITKPKTHYEEFLKRLNSKNSSIRNKEIMEGGSFFSQHEDDIQAKIDELANAFSGNTSSPKIKIILARFPNGNDGDDDEDEYAPSEIYGKSFNNRDRKSENFEVITKSHLKFKDIGGYDKIKVELMQCVDILSNYQKYQKYNVRVPKGLILEGPPGNGKTLLAKAFAGEAKVGFIPVSGSEFQEKYVGVGSSRVRELFNLAKKNIPCIIFIDEIDALGRKRSSDGETSSNERDNTLNELLVALDGFKNNTGIFVIGATNRADLLDPALTRPGRIDKRIFIGHPDSVTREAILNIHTKGKPYDESIIIKDLVDLTLGLSGAQIENLVNEGMLNALRENRTLMNSMDIEHIMNKMMAGWQPTDHQFTSDIIDHIAIHEMGHAVLGLVSKHHSKMTKVIINLSSPKSPAYTVFEGSTSTIYTREALFEHLSILLAGRIAEEVFYGVGVTTGAINDFEEAFKLAEKMVVYYGMGKKVIYPNKSDKFKEIIDTEVQTLINDAYDYAEYIVSNTREFILESAEILKAQKVLRAETLIDLIEEKYPEINYLNNK
jgi:cell division protease FtsH